MISRFERYAKDMMVWRHRLHACPELGFAEHATAQFVAEHLQRFGYDVHRGIGGTGLVAQLKVGTSNRSVGLRADMDALPMHEDGDKPYRSTHLGRMHACGHDGHMAGLLGAARYLAETRNFNGVVNLIFQPAEEGLGGARAMIEDGLFDRFPCDTIFSHHNRPGLPLGTFGLMPGAMMAGGASFDIVIRGKGSHGARPEGGVDPILVAGHLISALQSIVARTLSPLDKAVVSITQIASGGSYNVIPETASMGGTVRCFTREIMQCIEINMRRLVEQVAAGFGAVAELDFRVIFIPLNNDFDETHFLDEIAIDLVGENQIVRYQEPIMASDDFAFMLERVPGAYIHVGIGDAHHQAEVHNTRYDFNDAALPQIAATYASIAERKLVNRVGIAGRLPG